MRRMKHGEIMLLMLLSLAVVGAIVANNSSASASTPAACGISGCVSTPALSSSTTTSYNRTSTYSVTSTSVTISTSFSSSTTSTTVTTISTFFSYTSTISTSVTSSLTVTSISGTESTTNTLWSTWPTTLTTSSTYVVSSTATGIPIGPACPVTLVTNGSRLAPYASFLRGFRDNDIQNTNAGREFLLMFNSWYYSWAPWLTYTATTNPWVFKVVRVGVYPLIGILYAAYDAYNAIAPVNVEAGAITAGIIAASLMGVVYVAPIAFIATRIIRRHSRIRLAWRMSVTSTAWFLVSVAGCVAVSTPVLLMLFTQPVGS